MEKTLFLFLVFGLFAFSSCSKPEWDVSNERNFGIVCQKFFMGDLTPLFNPYYNLKITELEAKNHCECLLEGLKLNNIPPPVFVGSFDNNIALIKDNYDEDFSIKCREKSNLDYRFISK